MRFQVTLRYGTRRQRYHQYAVEADDAGEALRVASERMPAEIVEEVDLIEVRAAVDPDERPYLGE